MREMAIRIGPLEPRERLDQSIAALKYRYVDVRTKLTDATDDAAILLALRSVMYTPLPLAVIVRVALGDSWGMMDVKDHLGQLKLLIPVYLQLWHRVHELEDITEASAREALNDTDGLTHIEPMFSAIPIVTYAGIG